jgi:hypothetical protein
MKGYGVISSIDVFGFGLSLGKGGRTEAKVDSSKTPGHKFKCSNVFFLFQAIIVTSFILADVNNL